MTVVNTTRGVKLVLKVEDVPASGTYNTLCTINAERGITFNAQTNDNTIPDCDDPDQIAWIIRDKTSLSVNVTGAGVAHKQDVKRLWDWWKSEDPLSCKLILDDDDAANVITFTGDFHLTQWGQTGGRGARVEGSLSLSSDGEVTAAFGANVD